MEADDKRSNLETWVVVNLWNFGQALKMRSKLSSDFPALETGLVAVHGLVKLMDWYSSKKDAEMPETSVQLIQAALICDTILQLKPDDPQTLVLLTRIYLYLGAGSLALETFNRLMIKNLQWETTAHYLFTRLSTIHPYEARIGQTGRELFNPHDALGSALSVFRQAPRTLEQAEGRARENGNFAQVQEVDAVTDRQDNSLNKTMMILEKRGLEMLIGDKPQPEDVDLMGKEQRSTGRCNGYS